ncbi:unnamed protein product [Cyclocybe aegerita]|uniref:Uncharacterized protein n=1 Tax=Cyclocybe aegerita TaxID=1973307 RepID=A0A8S0XLF2_CYCAE|nr:unnamed protein product [Cyclocybe aegerita]
MAPDWGMIQVVIGLAVLVFVMPPHWAVLLRDAFRTLYLKWKPRDGQCEYLSYAEMTREPDTPVHHCRRACPHTHRRHIAGQTCWQTTISDFFDPRSFRRKIIEKPTEKLPLQQRYLCLDREVLHAFILCMIPASFAPKKIELARATETFEEGFLKIDVKSRGEDGSGPVVLHIAHNPVPSVQVPWNHSLTAHEIKCILEHYPPYYRKTLYYHHRPIPSPIRSFEDVKRGGWVVAVGLTKCEPVPVYMDILDDPINNRGAVFWRAIRRVKAIIQNNIQPLFQEPGEAKDICAVMRLLDYVLEEMTDSGLGGIIVGSRLVDPDALERLTVDQCQQAIQIFNNSPRLDTEGLERVRETLSPILLQVLCGIYWGVHLCIICVKNPGRELNRILPEVLIDEDRFYLQGC